MMAGKRQVPVTPDLYAIRIASQAATRWQCINTFKHGVRRWNILQRKELAQTLGVQMNLRRGMLKNRFDLRPEDEPPARLREIQRLNSEPIASHEEPPAARVPYGKAKHPAQVLNAILAEILVQVDDYFRVARRCKCMTAAPELLPKFLEVVDLAVENSDDAPVFIADRLLAPAQVDDAKAAHSKRHIFVEIHAGIIGTTVA